MHPNAGGPEAGGIWFWGQGQLRTQQGPLLKFNITKKYFAFIRLWFHVQLCLSAGGVHNPRIHRQGKVQNGQSESAFLPLLSGKSDVSVGQTEEGKVEPMTEKFHRAPVQLGMLGMLQTLREELRCVGNLCQAGNWGPRSQDSSSAKKTLDRQMGPRSDGECYRR